MALARVSVIAVGKPPLGATTNWVSITRRSQWGRYDPCPSSRPGPKSTLFAKSRMEFIHRVDEIVLGLARHAGHRCAQVRAQLGATNVASQRLRAPARRGTP